MGFRDDSGPAERGVLGELTGQLTVKLVEIQDHKKVAEKETGITGRSFC